MLNLFRTINGYFMKPSNIGRLLNTSNSSEDESRINIMNIQMINEKFQKSIFGSKSTPALDFFEIDSTFKKFKIDTEKTTLNKNVDFDLPPLLGEDIEIHLEKAAESLNEPYMALLKGLDKWNIPKMPETWSFQEGWTKYDTVNNKFYKVSVPEEDLLIFDVETLPKYTQRAVMAVAVGEKYWYSWTSKYLLNGNCEDDSGIYKDDLIPLYEDDDKSKPKCIVGHFVSFDRARIRDEYCIKGTGTRFIDTMSMQIAIRGMTSLQRSLKISYNNNNTENRIWKLYFNSSSKRGMNNSPEDIEDSDKWMSEASLNSLVDVYQYYFPNCSLSSLKDKRETFIKGTIEDVVNDFQDLMTYCATDVIMTAKVFQKLWSDYQVRFPHPASFTGMLEMGSLYLPVNSNLNTYINRASTKYESMKEKEKEILMELAQKSLLASEDKEYINDPWLWDLDWSVTKKSSLPKWFRLLVGKNQDSNTFNPDLITSQKSIAVKMLKLKWDGLPLHYDKKNKWGVLIPGCYKPVWNDEKFMDISNKLIWPIIPVERISPSYIENFQFPLQKYVQFWVPLFINRLKEFRDFLLSLGDSDSTRYDVFVEYMMAIVESINFTPESLTKVNSLLCEIKEISLRNNKACYKSNEGAPLSLYNFQMKDFSSLFAKTKCLFTENPIIPFVWFSPLPHEKGEGNFVGSPFSKSFLNYMISGRLTSHADNNLLEILIEGKKGGVFWRNYQNRVQSQFIVRTSKEKNESAIIPQVIVAGTVTRRSVERLWLTATNSTNDRVGSELKAMVQTPSNWVMVGADVDSQEQWIAAVLGDSVTGVHGGTPFGWLVLQGSKVDGTDLHSKTSKMIGISRNAAKVLNYSRMYGAGIKSSTDTLLKYNPELKPQEAFNKIKDLMKQTKGQRSQGKWVNGIESEVFSKLEEIAKSDEPSTPVLNARLSQALEKRVVNEKFMTSKCNWVVQSSGVDYLHCLLTFTKFLIQQYNINARLCICIHDEIRYLCEEKDKHRLALILQIANLYTRSVFSLKLNLFDLPQSIAFFSEIDIDYCLRKSPTDDCITPSNPNGLLNNYNIQKGESLNIYQILEITGGKLD